MFVLVIELLLQLVGQGKADNTSEVSSYFLFSLIDVILFMSNVKLVKSIYNYDCSAKYLIHTPW